MSGHRLPLLFFLLSGLFLPLPRLASADTIILNVVLNGEGKGDFFVIPAGTDDFLVKREDLEAIGFRDPSGKMEIIDGERYLSLKSIVGVRFAFIEKSLSLEITAAPELLPKRTMDFLPQRQANVHYPKDSSGFFNYGITYTAGSGLDFQSLDANSQLGIRFGEYLIVTDSTYEKTSSVEKFVRLMSNVTHDRRQRLDRWVVGDFFAVSGDLGSNLNLGGLSYSKVYRIDPYFIRYPLANFSGLLSLPSEAVVYLDGTRIRTEKLTPGEFELKNISYYGGASVVTVVLKDPFGREQRLVYPFYFTDILLKQGLHEYSYNLGFLREEFGEESNRYGRLAFSAFHNYGFGDALTAGFRTEGTKERFNLGPQASYLIPGAGIASLSVSGSRDERGKGGLAGLFTHGYQSRRINTRLLFRALSKEYATAGDQIQADKDKYQAAAGIGYGGTRKTGSLSLDFDTAKKHRGQDRRAWTIAYSRQLTRNSTLTATYRNIREHAGSHEFFAGFTYYPWKDVSLSASYKRERDTDTEALQVQKNQPVGEGFGYRASLERKDGPDAASTTLSPFVQYNARYGIYSAEYRGEQGAAGGTSEIYRFSASGGVAYVANTVGFSRPITDSFGLVKVGELQGVRVYQNGQEIGRTDRKGRVFLPNLGSYYENHVSISDKDIPIDYSLSEVVKYVSPPLRSGSLIPFEATKFQAITGTLHLKLEGETRPVEFHEVSLDVEGKGISFPTGKGGEFYLENVAPGSYKASFVYKGRTCAFEVRIPASDELIIDLGGQICEDLR
jgi:outer membrane usher protein FimD/PapC